MSVAGRAGDTQWAYRADRATRLVVIGSALAAVAFGAWLDSRAWDPLFIATAAVFGITLLLSRLASPVAHSAVLGIAYGAPVLVFAFGYLSPTVWTPWVAALLALSLRGGGIGAWSIPRPWNLPLALWALVIAITWPIVLLRELDFDVALLDASRLMVTGQGIPPAVQAVWISSVAASQLTGFLWLDAMFRRFRDRPAEFRRQVVWPLLISAAISAAVASYQWSVDIDFLNRTNFAGYHRAVGTMFDANAHGVATALWIGGSVVVAAGLRLPLRIVLLAAALPLLAAGVWASGSRTGLLVLLAGTGGAAWFWVMAPGATQRWRRISFVPLLLVAVFTLGAVMWPRQVPEGQMAVGPIARLVDSLFEGGRRNMREVGYELWRRDGWGLIADRMIEEHPVVGVGIGSFHALTLDYGPRMGENVTVDNAQSWVRHQLAELGVLGSLGWVAWLPLWLIALARRPRGDISLPARLIVFPLAGLLLASLLGLPSQNPAVLATFWVFVFWHAHASGRPITAGSNRWPAVAWAAIVVVAVVHAAATLVAARGELRLPARAAVFGWAFERGFHPLERGDGGATFRWSRRQATIALPVEGPYLRLRYWVHHPDASARPVHVVLNVGGATVVNEWLSDHVAREIYVRVTRNTVVDVQVDPAWVLTHETPPRELGVALADWRFVPAPPAGARVVDPRRRP